MPNYEAVFDGELWIIERDGETLTLEQTDGLGFRVEFDNEREAKRYVKLVTSMIEDEGRQT